MLAREYCKDLVSRYATGAGVGSMVPIPGTSLAITAAEVKLVADIARVYGETHAAAPVAFCVAPCGARASMPR